MLTSSGVKQEGTGFREVFADPTEALEQLAHQKSLHPEFQFVGRAQTEYLSAEGGYVAFIRFVQQEEDMSKQQQPYTLGSQEPVGPLKGQSGWRADKGYHPYNKSGFRATGHRVLLSPDEVEEVTASGIVLAKKTINAEKQTAVIATVIEIGLDAWADKSADFCEVGDRVLIGQYVGKFHESPVDGKEYRFVTDLDIISPIE